MKTLTDLDEKAQTAIICTLASSLLYCYLSPIQNDVDFIPSNIFNDLVLLTNGRHPKSDKREFPEDIKARIRLRLVENITRWAFAKAKESTYGEYHSFIFDHRKWLTQMACRSPQSFIGKD